MNVRKVLLPLCGVLFPAFFFAGDVLGGALATPTALPLPGAPGGEVARYYLESPSAVVAVAVAQILAAVALFAFARYIATFVRRMESDRTGLNRIVLGAGWLAAALLLVCAALSFVLLSVASSGNAELVLLVRQLNFLYGGTLHVATLGVYVGSASLAGRRAHALPSWIVWLGIGTAAIGILSLTSLLVFPAALLILVGRLFGFLWSIAAAVVLISAMSYRRGLRVAEHSAPVSNQSDVRGHSAAARRGKAPHEDFLANRECPPRCGSQRRRRRASSRTASTRGGHAGNTARAT
jgi:hypothetical protein